VGIYVDTTRKLATGIIARCLLIPKPPRMEDTDPTGVALRYACRIPVGDENVEIVMRLRGQLTPAAATRD
jgi:hypothetical protein